MSTTEEQDLEAPGFVIVALRRHRATQAERRLLLGSGSPLEGDVDDLVVERGGGEPWHPSTFSSYWRRFAKGSGFEGITFHGLRHGTGALLLDAGVPGTVALAIMGHSATTMLRHYHEMEDLRLVARGATNHEVAARLFVSEATVKTHLLHVYAKLGVNDRAAAVAAAYEQGLLTPGDTGL